MIRKVTLFLLFIVPQLSCSEVSEQSKIALPANNEIVANPTPDKTTEVKPLKHPEEYKFVVYNSLLYRVIYDKGYERNFFDEIKPIELLIFRNETIEPKNIEDIENIEDIQANLLNNFKLGSKRIKRLSNSYGNKHPVVSMAGDSDLPNFYKTAKKKYPDATAVVGFSDVAISDDHKQAFAYVEFYSPNKNLVKVYFQLELEKYVMDTEYDSFTNAKVVKAYPVD